MIEKVPKTTQYVSHCLSSSSPTDSNATKLINAGYATPINVVKREAPTPNTTKRTRRASAA